MRRRKTTIYLPPELLKSVKVWAARTGRKDYEILEDALKAYLGYGVLENVWSRSDLAESEALELAYGELHASRR